jgi:hypothetical protein
MTEAEEWARSEFGDADLGDVRRTERLVAMGAVAVQRPSGKVAGVFNNDREREGAYDFLENRQVAVADVLASVAAATTARCEGMPFVFVPVDGTSITVVDKRHERDFGNVGNDTAGARGLKLVDALAVDPGGTPVGWLAMEFWARSPQRKIAPPGTHARRSRPLEQKETKHWVKAVEFAAQALDERNVRGWFLIDREGDGRDLLLTLRGTQHWWTVRASQDRSIEVEDGNVEAVRSQMAKRKIVGTYDLNVAARTGRRGRVARMVVRIAQITLRLRATRDRKAERFSVTVVWAREEGTTPPKEQPIDWLLYTNRTVETAADAQLVVNGYSQRWRIEECHRTWKAGDCDVESTQLRSSEAVQLWAVILGAVAVRIERLKRLARRKPDEDANLELTPVEIRALTLLREADYGPVSSPTISQAVAWLAEMCGWTNKYSGSPPGATVIGRGLRYLRPAARMLEIKEGVR